MTSWTTLNPTDLFQGAISGAGLVFTPGPFGTNGAYCRALDGYNTGKYYFEVARTTAAFDYMDGTGIALHAATLTGMNTGADCALIGEFGPGNQMAVDGATVYQNALSVQNTLMGIAVDLGAGLVWARPTATATWNNSSGSANPATATGGFSLGSLVGQVVFPLVVSQSDNTYVFTCNFGQGAFSGLVPSGFTPGWPARTVLGRSAFAQVI
jgi:hypothetical protein